jgi:hypothetical protein
LKQLIILLVTLFCLTTTSWAEEKYSNAILKVLVTLEGNSALYVTLLDCGEDVWFNAPPGKDDTTVAIAIASIAMESQLFITYDDETMELISVGILGE